MKKTKKTLVILFFIFCLLLSITTLISFSSNTTTQEVLIKSIKPVYDETSGVVVSDEGVVFNDKNQVVKYNVVLENTQNYDVKIADIKLSTPTEEFLSYKVEGVSTEDEIKANSTKELTVSFETMGIKGWGRNFADELTANISFEKVSKQEEEIPPVEEDKAETQPEAPATNTEELISKTEKIEIIRVTKDTIEFKGTNKLETGDKIAVWLYSEPIFLGYFNVVEKDGVKQIVGLEEALKKVAPEIGDHNLALVSEEQEEIGYVSIYINENKELLKEKPQDSTNKEDLPVTKPSTDNKDESTKEDETGKVENPYTSDKKLVGLLIITTCITGVAVIVASKNKLTKYTIFILMLSPAFTITNAEEVIEVAIKNNVNFESQNVMKPSYILADDGTKVRQDYWAYAMQIKNFYIHNEVIEIKDYAHKFDVTESGNARVIAYLVKNKNDNTYYDAYLVADGIIYPNPDAYGYFHDMKNLDILENLAGLDTSEVTDMTGMFSNTGYNSKSFTLDLSGFNTSQVTNMRAMFQNCGYNSEIFTLDISGFNTSQVTNMRAMFNKSGYSSSIFTLDVSSFDTSNVIDMGMMFQSVGYSNKNFTLDVSGFDTSNVTDMNFMFNDAGYNSSVFLLDVSNFDTSKVTNMSAMFQCSGYNSPIFNLDVSNFDTSNVTNMEHMFYKAGYNNLNFNLNLSNFDTSKVTNMNGMLFGTGYNSTKLNTSITIKNINATLYDAMFNNLAIKEGTQIKVNYIKETEELVDKMIATKTEGANVVKGNLIVDVDKLTTGDEIHISGEKFNVINQTDDTITMLAQLNLGTDYKQSTTAKNVAFSSNGGWEYTPGPKEIDIQKWTTNPKTYVNAYVEYLKEQLGDDTVTGDLITLKDLEALGCTIPSDYAYGSGERNCYDSPYGWIVNGQYWWTRSADSTGSLSVWNVSTDGGLLSNYYGIGDGIRPVITISKSSLKTI